MNDIPEDIMATAQRVCDHEQHDSWIISTVACAIKAERERCADIVYLCSLDATPPIKAWRKIIDGKQASSEDAVA